MQLTIIEITISKIKIFCESRFKIETFGNTATTDRAHPTFGGLGTSEEMVHLLVAHLSLVSIMFLRFNIFFFFSVWYSNHEAISVHKLFTILVMLDRHMHYITHCWPTSRMIYVSLSIVHNLFTSFSIQTNQFIRLCWSAYEDAEFTKTLAGKTIRSFCCRTTTTTTTTLLFQTLIVCARLRQRTTRSDRSSSRPAKSALLVFVFCCFRVVVVVCDLCFTR
jgi:hypothetical protein